MSEEARRGAFGAPGGCGDLAAAWALAARWLAAEIDDPLLEAFATEPVPDVLERAAPGAGAMVRRPWSDTERGAAAEEFARLFLLPGPTLPRAALHADTRGAEAFRARLAAVEEVLDWVPPDPFAALPEDHVARALLVAAAAAAVDAGLFEEVRVHLLQPVVPRFARALSERARHPLYRALAVVLQGLVETPADGEAGAARGRPPPTPG